MKIMIGKNAGFCFGVSNAVKKSIEILNKNSNVYCIGEVVHNKQVNENLIKNGLKIVDSISDVRDNLIIRAHGEVKEIYVEANEKNILIEDLTCPKVLKIHNIVKEYTDNDYFVFLIGNKNHPETVGTKSYCSSNSYIIESIEDIEVAYIALKKSNLKNLLVITQTTFNLEKFNEISSQIPELIKDDINIEIKNTICASTKLRQEETIEISSKVDAMIIIGGKNSSNTIKLFEISKKNCKNCFLIETYKELDLKKLKRFEKIGIMAGASTPYESIEKVVNLLNR